MPNIRAIDRITPEDTQCVDLTAGFPRVINRWSESALRQARKAKTLGIGIAIAKTIRDWEAYFNADTPLVFAVLGHSEKPLRVIHGLFFTILWS